MMYCSIFASFCLLGMASSQSIESLTACVTKEQNLKMDCKFITTQNTSATCTYEVDRKVIATNGRQPVDDSFKNRGVVKINNNICTLTLTGFADDKPKIYNCTILQDKSVTKGLNVEKKSLVTCTAGNTLSYGGVTLLLAFVLPLLSQML